MENIKIEAGKFYRTRVGNKAFVVALRPPEEGMGLRYPIIGYHGEFSGNWTAGGQWNDNGDKSPNDLVAEWKEPKRIKGWVNLYRTDSHPLGVLCNNAIHLTKDAADDHALGGRFACIEIDVLEGQGLDGSAA